LAFVDVENGLFDGGGSSDGTEEFCTVVLVGLKADELKELEETGLAPNGFRLETVGRKAELDGTIGVDGKDVVCVTGEGDIVGVGTAPSLEKMLPQTSSSSHPFDDPSMTVSCFTVTPSARPTRLSKLIAPPTGLETTPETETADLSSKR